MKSAYLVTITLIITALLLTIGSSSCGDDEDNGSGTVAVTSTSANSTAKSSTSDLPTTVNNAPVDTGQDFCCDDNAIITCPDSTSAYYGQDAQYQGAEFAFQDNGDGTVTDLNTGLMWQQIVLPKVTFDEAFSNAATYNLAGYSDWRVPTIKELYSLIDFRGHTGTSEADSIPYIDTNYFDFDYGDTATERFIDAQYWSSAEYVSTTMNNDPTVFGVNFADGRIKGYPKEMITPTSTEDKKMFIRYVRGATGYGENDFVDNGDQTITDNATGLMWMKDDSGYLNAGTNSDGKLNWQEALYWAENLTYAGYDDWRLPNAKELQQIVDYSRSPDTTASPALDPIFNTTSFVDGNGLTNYGYFWTNTTHYDGPNYSYAAYIAFGEALGYMEQPPGSGNYVLMDVHGAGAQRSDPKSGDPASYPYGHGPQNDVISIYNYVRCVRGGTN